MDVKRRSVAGSVWARWCMAFSLFFLSFVFPNGQQPSVLAVAVAGEPTSGSVYGVNDSSTTAPDGYLSMNPGFTAGSTFTVEGWVKSPDLSKANAIVMIGADPATANYRALTLNSVSATQWSVDISGLDRLNFTTKNSVVLENNTWHYVALVGDADGIAMWINGEKMTTTGCAVSISNCEQLGSGNYRFKYTVSGVNYTTFKDASKSIGAWKANTRQSRGASMSELRFTNSALYSSTASVISLPTAPLTSVAQTQLLLTAVSANPLSDASGSQTITQVGIVNAPEGSINFDTNQGLTYSGGTGTNVGTSDFTVEAWLYQTKVSGSYPAIFDSRTSANDANGMSLFSQSIGGDSEHSRLSLASPQERNLETAGLLSMNIWQHVALVRESGKMRIFVDGASAEVANFPSNITNIPFHLGRNRNGVDFFNGRISNFRIVKGVNVYSSPNFATSGSLNLGKPRFEPLVAVPGTTVLIRTLYDATGTTWKGVSATPGTTPPNTPPTMTGVPTSSAFHPPVPIQPSLQMSLPDNPPTVVYGMTTTLAAQVSTAGSVTFKSGGVTIAGCSNVAAVAFVATCSWKANAANSNTQLTADFLPTDSVTYTNLSGVGLMTLNVGKASAVVVASSPTVEYGDAVPVITSSVIGLVNGDAEAVVTGLSCSTNYTTLSAVGSLPTTGCSGGAASNYLIAYSAGSVTVNSISQSALTLQNSTFEFGNTLTLNASGGSGNGSYSYSLSSSGSAGCSRSGATLSASTVGSCTVTVTRDAGGNYSSRSQNFTITVEPSDQNILMVDDVRGYYGSPLALSTSGGSGNGVVTYAVTSSGTAGCFIAANGTDLLAVSAGTCTITATKAASTTYRIRTSTVAMMTFDKIAQPSALVLSDSSFTYGATLTLSASGGNGDGTLSYGVSSAGSADCSVNGSVLSASSGGSCSIIATRAASTNYISHTESFTVTVSKAVQATLSIANVNGSYGDGLALTASGGSGNGAVTFSVSSAGTAGCSLFLGVVTVSSPGSCTVIANKGTDDSYLAKNSATTLLTFSKGIQSSLVLADDGMLFGVVLTLSASGGNGDGAIAYALTSAGTANCSLSNTEVSATSTGTCTIAVTKYSSSNYYSKTQNFAITVGIAPQASLIVVTTSGTVGESLPLSVTGGSGNGAVSWSVAVVGTARCGLIGSTLLATSAGTCTVRVSKASDDNYLGASGTQVIVFAVPPTDIGQQGVPSVASSTSTSSTTTTTTTTTTIPTSAGKGSGGTGSSLAPKTSTTSTTVVGSEKTLQKNVRRVAASEALMLQGDSSFAAVVTRDHNSLVMSAGLFKATIRGIDRDGNVLALDIRGDLRIPVGGFIEVDMGKYESSSDVFIWMFSTPKSLGERRVDGSGKIVSRIATPSDVEQGLHRIAFVGKNQSGGDITFMFGLIIADPSALTVANKILIAIPIAMAIFMGLLVPTTIRRRRKQRAM